MHSGTRCHCGALFIFILRDTCGLWRVIFIYMYSKVQNCRIKRRELLLLTPPYYRELANVLFGILSSELIVFWLMFGRCWRNWLGNVGEIGWAMLVIGQCVIVALVLLLSYCCVGIVIIILVLLIFYCHCHVGFVGIYCRCHIVAGHITIVARYLICC